MTTAIVPPRTRTVDMKLEVVVIPVSDVDRAKRFYEGLGWRLDADFIMDDDFRVVQFTPPGSPCSIHFGTARTGVTSAVPGSAQGLYLIVSDIEAARADLLNRGVDVSEVFHRTGREGRFSGPDPERRSYSSFVSFSDPDGNGWLVQEVTTRLPGRVDGRRHDIHLVDRSSRPPSDVRRPRTASMKSGPVKAMRTGQTGTLSTSSRSRQASNCHHEQYYDVIASYRAPFTISTDTAGGRISPIVPYIGKYIGNLLITQLATKRWHCTGTNGCRPDTLSTMQHRLRQCYGMIRLHDRTRLQCRE